MDYPVTTKDMAWTDFDFDDDWAEDMRVGRAIQIAFAVVVVAALVFYCI